MSKNKTHILILAIYTILFYAAWAVYTTLLKEPMTAAVGNEYISTFLSEGVIKNLIWTLPAILLIAHFREEMAIGLKEMLHLHKADCRYLLYLIPLFLFVAGSQLLNRHSLTVSQTFTPSLIIMIVFVGFNEEIVFRGVFLNVSLRYADNSFKRTMAFGINAVMFLLIHFPKWISQGTLGTAFSGFGFLTVMILSVLFSYCFMKTRSIWIPVILHSLYDLTVILLV